VVSAVVRGSIYRTHVMPSAGVMIARLRPNKKMDGTSRALNDAMDPNNVVYNSGIRIGSTLQCSVVREEEKMRWRFNALSCAV